jgi:hypothetical protein
MAKTATPKRKTDQAKPRQRRPTGDEAQLRHNPGCPEDPDRVESYPQNRPDGSEVRVTRCTDCAAGVVVDVD